MPAPLTLSLDAMGGDFGPDIVVPGAALALERHPGTRFLIFGDQAKVGPVLAAHPKLQSVSTLHHTDVAVRMDDKPSQALRHGRRVSSMWRAIEAVKSGEAQAAISAGNTGALMAMAMFCLKCMDGIDRPALAALWPTLNGESVVLDVGASIGADAPQLVKLAIMGAAMAQIVFDRRQPSVGLLNVGVEEMKGVEEVREAGRFLRENPLPDLSYRGFVEGDDIGKGAVDVVVTEGFAGNIALKTAEGTAKQIAEYLRAAMKSSLMTKIGYLFARGGFSSLREKLDPRRSNGGVFLGLNGVVIKSHGGTDSLGFAAAIDLGYDMAHYDLRTRIGAILSNLGDIHERVSPAEANSVKSGATAAADGGNR